MKNNSFIYTLLSPVYFFDPFLFDSLLIPIMYTACKDIFGKDGEVRDWHK